MDLLLLIFIEEEQSIFNQKLNRVYNKYWDNMVFSLQGKELGNPLLLHIKDEEKYKTADIKIMFFGQETNSWYESLGSKDMDELMNLYSDFLGRSYSSQFWNAVHNYVYTIQQRNPDKSVEFIWNNILKIGKVKSKGKPKKDLVKLQKEVFPVIREEVEILMPDVVIFFTGPNYDYFIKKEWDESVFKGIETYNKRQLSIIEHASLPRNSFRTYHPNYLYRQGKIFYSNIQDTILANSSQVFSDKITTLQRN